MGRRESHPNWSVVFGYPRSGTTFLVEVLGRVDHHEAVSERAFPPQIGAIWNNEASEEVREALRYSLRFTLEHHVVMARHARAFTVSQVLQKNVGLREAAESLRRSRRVDGLTYKEPFLSFAPEFAWEALDGCRIVHIYRDGRDAADSMIRSFGVLTDESLTSTESLEVTFGRGVDGRLVPWWVENGREEEFLAASPYVRAIWMWAVMVRRAHEFCSRPDVVESGRVLEVRYESLVSDPATECARVLDHLRLRTNRRVEAKSKSAHARSVGVHRRRDADEVAQATACASAELELLGYL